MGRRTRIGLALPLAVLVIGFMMAAAVTAFTRLEGLGGRAGENTLAVEAFALAQTGLERALAEGDAAPRDTTYELDGGEARVRRVLVRAAAGARDTSVWLFRSTGRVRDDRRPQASREVAQWAYRTGGDMQVLSAWTSLSGVLRDGASGSVSGSDECGATATVPGLAVPTDGFRGSVDGITGSRAVLDLGNRARTNSRIRIDWNRIVDPAAPAVPPDYIYCPGGAGHSAAWNACNGWPAARLWGDTAFWPVILVNGSSALPSHGRGTLLVTGDLIVGDGDRWDGIVLVGGRLLDTGRGDLSGATVSGLDVLLGEQPQQPSIAAGATHYRYNSCEVARAADRFARMVPMRNAWFDPAVGAR